jgi:adenosylcobinamide-GDP ribazoletransferase
VDVVANGSPWVRRVADEVRAAFGLLTRLPVRVADATDPGAAAFALVGAVVGFVAAVPLVLLAFADEPVLGAIAGVALLAAVSGGLHLDGLADTADALIAPDAVGAERARHDPAVGPGGAATLLLVLGGQVAALASASASSGALVGGVSLVAAGAVSRWLPVLAVATLRPRIPREGLGAWFGDRVSAGDAVVGAVTTALVAGLGAVLAGWPIALAGLGGGAIGLAGSALIAGARGRLDGDGLGASVEITMTATVVILAVLVR